MIVRRYPEQYQDVTRSSPEKNVPRAYRCGLCEKIFDSEEKLNKHIEIVGH